MAIVAVWHDYQHRRVNLNDDGWDHICIRHPDLADRLAEIGVAVASPSLVMRDLLIRRIEHHYGALAGRLRIHVVVLYRPTQDGWIGTIVTALRSRRVIPGNQLWP